MFYVNFFVDGNKFASDIKRLVIFTYLFQLLYYHKSNLCNCQFDPTNSEQTDTDFKSNETASSLHPIANNRFSLV